MITSILSHKGGVAKTTTAVHLCGYFSHLGGRTALVDGDPNRSAMGWAKRGSLPFQVIDERAATSEATRELDYVVIDTKARLDIDDLGMLAARCDLLIIPCTPDALALAALMRTTSMLDKLRARYRVLLTIIPPRPSREGEEARRALADLKIPMFTTCIRRLVAFQKAANKGVLVDAVEDPRADLAWADCVALGAEVGAGGM